MKRRRFHPGHLLRGLMIIAVASNTFAAGVDVEKRAITVPLYQEPRILDSAAAPTVEFTAEILAHIQEGLMRLDSRRRVVGGVATSWEITPTTLRFQLREDARWQSGEPVTADDFVFAWRRLVNPATGSQSANLASPIRNALAILRGEMPPSSLGVHAASPRELVVDLAHPCSWCLKAMTTSAFYPINQKFYEGVAADYGSSAGTHLANGPFGLAQWQRGKSITLTRNEHYWRRDEIFLNELRYGYIAGDAKSQLNLYRSGDIAVAKLDRDTMAEGLELGQRIRTGPTGYLMHLQFSHKPGMNSANENLRKAIALTIDKEELLNRVIAIPGSRIANSMFHEWMAAGDKRVADVIEPATHEPDLELARQYLDAAKAELGIEGRVSVTYTIFDNSTMRRIAEYLQQRLALIDITMKIDPQTVQMLLDKWFKGTSDMTMIGWIPDVDDPIDQISFLGNPDIRGVFQGLYPGQDMTQIYYDYRDAPNQAARDDVVRRAHAFFSQRVTVIPLYESSDSALIDPRLTGYVFQPVRAFNDYRNIRIREAN